MNVALKAVSGKRILLSLLAVSILIGNAMLAIRIVQQNKAINSQRTLIRLLHKDNLFLSSLRKQARQKTQVQATPSATLNSKTPSSKVPVIQVPPTQVPPEKVPSAQVSSEKTPSPQVPSGKTSSKSDRKSGKAHKPAPSRPPSEVTDPSDLRRVSFAI